MSDCPDLESVPGQGYEPDPPSLFVCRYLCPDCGARYEAHIAVETLAGCRNKGCDGRPVRLRGDWP